jgi:hypothetical protein
LQNEDWRLDELAIGDWRLAIGDWRLAIGDWRCDLEHQINKSSIRQSVNLQSPIANLQ